MCRIWIGTQLQYVQFNPQYVQYSSFQVFGLFWVEAGWILRWVAIANRYSRMTFSSSNLCVWTCLTNCTPVILSKAISMSCELIPSSYTLSIYASNEVLYLISDPPTSYAQCIGTIVHIFEELEELLFLEAQSDQARSLRQIYTRLMCKVISVVSYESLDARFEAILSCLCRINASPLPQTCRFRYNPW